MANYQNILDFFSFIEKINLCTTPYCTTCGAREFRAYCKELGNDQIRILIEATTEKDLNEVSPSLWYDPITIIIKDGFIFNHDCDLMRIYNKGYNYLINGDQKDTILSIGDVNIYSKVGSILDERSVDIIVLFENPGLTSLSIDIKYFFKNLNIDIVQEELMICDGKLDKVKAIYYAKTHDALGMVHNVKNYLHTMLDTVSAVGYSSVALNGIKTKGYSEYDNLRIISKWISDHPDTSIKQIILVDKRAGFTKLAAKINNSL